VVQVGVVVDDHGLESALVDTPPQFTVDHSLLFVIVLQAGVDNYVKFVLKLLAVHRSIHILVHDFNQLSVAVLY